MYDIEHTETAIQDLQWFTKRDQKVILDGIERRLRHEPTVATRHRKRLRPNSTAKWELRLGDFRVLYDVEPRAQVVEIKRIGEKRGHAFLFRGRKEEL
jgi:mRNA-degrading endonuclease RelE of RelBE toxin-antitoxin system